MHTSISLRFILLSVILALCQSQSATAWNPALQVRGLVNKADMSLSPRAEGATVKTETTPIATKRPTETCDQILKNIKSKTDSSNTKPPANIPAVKAERRAENSPDHKKTLPDVRAPSHPIPDTTGARIFNSRSLRAERRAASSHDAKEKSDRHVPAGDPRPIDSCSELEKVMKAEIEAAQQKNGIAAKIAKTPSTASPK